MQLRIKYLVEHVDVIPLLAMWMYEEWGLRTPFASIDQEIRRLNLHLNTDRLPLTLVAFSESRAVGTVSLVNYDMETRMDLTPWLASLYVTPEARGEGVGEVLLESAEEKAAALGVEALYLWTSTADREQFYRDRGWVSQETAVFREQTVTIMKKDLPAESDESGATHGS